MFKDIAKEYPIYLINIQDEENEDMVKDIYEAYFLNEYGESSEDEAPMQVPRWYSFLGRFLINKFSVSDINPDDAYLAFFVPRRLVQAVQNLRETLGENDVFLSELKEGRSEG